MANEKRLIDANAVLDKIRNSTASEATKVTAFVFVDTAPTVDAVEVVRCKDCKHWVHMEDSMGDCTNERFHLDDAPDPTMKFDEFCCLGERRTEE